MNQALKNYSKKDLSNSQNIYIVLWNMPKIIWTLHYMGFFHVSNLSNILSTHNQWPVTDRPFILETVLTLILGNSSQTVLWYTLKSDLKKNEILIAN